MKISIIFMLECFIGFILFAKVSISNLGQLSKSKCRISVIIPARNEEHNLPYILNSLKEQTYTPYEIIVVDDFSTDKTEEIANKYGAKVLKNSELPDNWTGKTWAVWNGFLHSSGDILAFLDADVRLAPNALEALLKAREKSGGVISVVPFHHTEKFYERLSLVPYLLGVFAFTSPFERLNTQKGLYGSCIVATREDYEKINGHDSIKSELLDDLNLGRKFSDAGINVENFIGHGIVSFRMYPDGIRSEIEGFGKGAVLSTAILKPATIILISIWLIGLFTAGFLAPALIALNYDGSLPFVIGYIVYTLQIIYFLKVTGSYGKLIPILHFLSSLFFVIIMLYSLYQVKCLGCVSWKGRLIKVGDKSRI